MDELEFSAFFDIRGGGEAGDRGDVSKAGGVLSLDEARFGGRHVVFREGASFYEVAGCIEFRDADVVFGKGGFEGDTRTGQNVRGGTERGGLVEQDDLFRRDIGARFLLSGVERGAEDVIAGGGGFERIFLIGEGDGVVVWVAIEHGDRYFTLAGGLRCPWRAAEFKIGEGPVAGGIHFELFDSLAGVAYKQERVDLLPSDTMEVEAVPVRV